MKAYADLVTLKRTLGIDAADVTRDADLLRALEAASAEIDADTERTFQPYRATRYYTYTPGGWGVRYDKPLWIADLLTLDSLVVDGSTWDAADYVLLPAEAPDRRQPYTRLAKATAGTKSFVVTERAVVLTGLWGYWQELRGTGGATLSAGIDADDTSVTVSAAGVLSPGQTLLIDNEQMYLTDLSGTTLTVERGVNGTTAAAHLSGAPIQRYAYPRAVVRETLVRATTEYRSAEQAGISRVTVDDITVQYGEAAGGSSGRTPDRLYGLRRRALFA